MRRLWNPLVEYFIILLVLVGVPFACAWFGGKTGLIESVLTIVPRSGAEQVSRCQWIYSCPFSWWAFAAVGAVGCAMVAPFVWRGLRNVLAGLKISATSNSTLLASHSFPLWGWLGIVVMVAGWIVAWNRFAWCAPIQRHTYLIIWLGFIVAMNGLVHWRSGRSPLTDDSLHYLSLFPVSSAFWWFFEYLNRYVWNWYYVGIEGMTGLEYFVFASLSFSTVLPGVKAVAELLGTFRLFGEDSFAGMMRIDMRSRWTTLLLVLGSAIGLVGIVFIPEFTYPFLWVSPVLVVVLVKRLTGSGCALDDISDGNWSLVVRYAVAALICGFVWELWNWNSLAKWIYDVPYVHRFQYFEMPLLGLFGYIPFGVECLTCG